jgi:hypothetical protein
MENIEDTKSKNRFEKKLNTDLGFYFWKFYISSAFWANIVTPMNLIITILSALISAQANTGNLLSDTLYKEMSIVLLLLSTVNSFLQPHIKLRDNTELQKSFDKIGCEFDEVYFTNTTDDEKVRLYKKLIQKINDVRFSQKPETQNYLTDLIHIICRWTLLKNGDMWLDFYDVKLKPFEENNDEQESNYDDDTNSINNSHDNV